MNLLKVNNLAKEFIDDSGFKILLFEDISFEIGTGEIVTIVAPKGTGKSTLLKTIFGIEKSTGGSVECNCKLSLIPSEPSSFPWLNVKENLEVVNHDQNVIKEIIDKVGLSGYEMHYPHNSSNAFRFRISLARSLATEAKIILIDEPFTNFDHLSRDQILLMIRQISKTNGISFLFTSTNVSTATALSDRLILLSNNPGTIVNEYKIEHSNDELLADENEIKRIRDEFDKDIAKTRDHTVYNINI